MAKKNPWDNAIDKLLAQRKKVNPQSANDLECFVELMRQNRVLNSQFQIYDKVVLDFFKEGEVTGAMISKVIFTQSKVLYDVEISSTYKDDSDKRWTTRIHSIDGNFIRAAK